MTNALDTTGYTVEKDETTGVITLTPKRVRKKNGETYFVHRIHGGAAEVIEYYGTLDQDTFDYGNYYDTKAQGQAVSALRKHVYKFPAVCLGKKHWCHYWNNIWFKVCNNGRDDMYIYFHDILPITATEEDRAERARLIKNCYDLLGYVTI